MAVGAHGEGVGLCRQLDTGDIANGDGGAGGPTLQDDRGKLLGRLQLALYGERHGDALAADEVGADTGATSIFARATACVASSSVRL